MYLYIHIFKAEDTKLLKITEVCTRKGRRFVRDKDHLNESLPSAR